MRITGKTGIMFVLAHPVGHVRASAVLNEYFQARGLDFAAAPLQVAPEDLGIVLDGIRAMSNVAGFGVTIPHKIAVIRHLDAITEEARRCGAVNFVRREADGNLIGTNLDGVGFVTGLRAAGVGPAGKSILQLGAGGAGRAVAFALAAAGAGVLTIANRDGTKARELARAVATGFPTVEVHAGNAARGPFDLLVNTTSLGMKPDDPLPFDLELVEHTPVIADIVMTPPETKLLATASRAGRAVVPGRAMLDAQMDLVAKFLKIH
ncbi:shikimate dehydrogenase [Aquamicrobium sp. LC103]|uniref:shikimate dehydrogenase family protein n=1 Tax=Aquamicrobium sp. LC103 TaxID=1120658 RepID=UPI00063EAF04|nr:shikimate dehydrogenase [Aquamicrobium sp. LC103]TKT69294.1 shikimate dehydrogenase [Aquamicrobium sp. LC103]